MATSKIQKTEVNHKEFEASVEITSYTQGSQYIAPSDGFARIIVAYAQGNGMTLYVDNQSVVSLSAPSNGSVSQNLIGSFPVYKGQSIYATKVGTGTNRAYFNAYSA